MGFLYVVVLQALLTFAAAIILIGKYCLFSGLPCSEYFMRGAGALEVLSNGSPILGDSFAPLATRARKFV